jgi:hypothetical protein
MNALVLALALAASPFPPPRAASVTDRMKCDFSTVLSVDAAKGEVRGTTPAGIVTYKVGPGVQVLDAAGKPTGGAASLTVGQKVRIYYVVDDGARVVEIDAE